MKNLLFFAGILGSITSCYSAQPPFLTKGKTLPNFYIKLVYEYFLEEYDGLNNQRLRKDDLINVEKQLRDNVPVAKIAVDTKFDKEIVESIADLLCIPRRVAYKNYNRIEVRAKKLYKQDYALEEIANLLTIPKKEVKKWHNHKWGAEKWIQDYIKRDTTGKYERKLKKFLEENSSQEKKGDLSGITEEETKKRTIKEYEKAQEKNVFTKELHNKFKEESVYSPSQKPENPSLNSDVHFPSQDIAKKNSQEISKQNINLPSEILREEKESNPGESMQKECPVCLKRTVFFNGNLVKETLFNDEFDKKSLYDFTKEKINNNKLDILKNTFNLLLDIAIKKIKEQQ